MPVSPEKIQQARAAGYSDREITEYLRNQGYAEGIDSARRDGASYNDVVRSAAGEKRGIAERLKQGMADFYLATGQAGNAIGQAVGGDIQFGPDGIKFVGSDELARQEDIWNTAAQIQQERVGDAGIGAEIVRAAGNPINWIAGTQLAKVPQLFARLAPATTTAGKVAMSVAPSALQGAGGAAAYEAALPQPEGFDLGEKAGNMVEQAGYGAVLGPVGEKTLKGVTKVGVNMPIAGLSRVAKKGYDSLRGKGAEGRAAKRIQELTPDVQNTVGRLNEEPLAQNLTPAQRAGDEELLGLEDAVRRENPGIDDRLTKQNELAQAELRAQADEIGEGVSPEATTAFIRGRADKVTKRLNERASDARFAADETIEKAAPKQRPSEAAVSVREGLDDALTAARQEESALWAQVPEDQIMDPSNTLAVFDAMMKKTPAAQKEDIPEIARRLLSRNSRVSGEAGENALIIPGSEAQPKLKTTIAEMQGLRSKLLEEARVSRANGQYNKARLASDLADSLLEDMGATADGLQGEAGEAVRIALDKSKEVAEKFKRGNVSRVLGSDRAGGSRVAPERTLETTVGSGKTKGAVAARELQDAAPDSAPVREGIQDYMRDRFQAAAVRDGKVNQRAADKFIKENEDILQSFPELQDEFSGTVSAENVAAGRSARAQTVEKGLSGNQSTSGRFLNAKVDKEFDSILSAQNPKNTARELVKQASKDKSGKAVKGLKTSAVQHLMRKATGKDGTISGSAIKGELSDKRTMEALREVLSPEEIGRVNRIAEAFQTFERGNRKQVDRVMNGKANRLLEFVVSVAGARTGAKLGKGTSGASLLTAGFAAKNARESLNKVTFDKAEKLLQEAVEDPELMKILLTKTDSAAAKEQVRKRLDSWAEKTGFDKVRSTVKTGSTAAVAEDVTEDDEE